MAFLKTIYTSFLDLLFPGSKIISQLENMDVADFMSRVNHAELVPRNTIEIFAAIDYHNKFSRNLIWAVKFRGNRKVSKLAAKILNDFLIEELSQFEIFSDFKSALLIPLPLSKERLRERGFNQAELIASELLKLGLSEQVGSKIKLAPDILFKKINTPAQTSMKNKKDRLKNLRGCFEVRKEKQNEVRGKNIILLDDVVTTGATMNEAAKTLYRSGARKVLGFALAH